MWTWQAVKQQTYLEKKKKEVIFIYLFIFSLWLWCQDSKRAIFCYFVTIDGWVEKTSTLSSMLFGHLLFFELIQVWLGTKSPAERLTKDDDTHVG